MHRDRITEYYKLALWLALWFLVWAVGFYFGAEGKYPIFERNRILVLSIFIAGILLAYLLFPYERAIWTQKSIPALLSMIALAALLFILIDHRNTLSSVITVAHVFFQQVMISFLVFMKRPGRPIIRVLCLYGLSHLLLVVFGSPAFAVAITLFSLLGGTIFAILMTRSRWGIASSYTIHIAFYVLQFRLI